MRGAGGRSSGRASGPVPHSMTKYSLCPVNGPIYLFPDLKQLVGVESLGSNAGDKMKMCEDALERLKAELASTKEHKTRITVDVSLEGIRIMEEKTRKLLYSHKVHQLVFIAFDVKVQLIPLLTKLEGPNYLFR